MISFARPPGLDSTPRERVFRRGKLELFRITSSAAPTAGPLLLIPPLMVKPYIYDLHPRHSFVGYLRDAGHDVFLVDFGVPDAADSQRRLDHYVLEDLPACIDAVLAASSASGLALVGYCMGGLFALIHVGTHDDERIRALVTIGAPVNFRQMGAITIAARVGAPIADPLIDLIGNVPGWVSSTTFKLLSARRLAKAYVDLARHWGDEKRWRSFRAINHWMSDMIPYPREAFRQMFHQVVRGNRLVRGGLRFGDRSCELSRVRCPVLAFAGAQDIIAPPEAIEEVVDLVGSSDKRLHVRPGGHVGVMAGSAAPQQVWQPTHQWLSKRLLD